MTQIQTSAKVVIGLLAGIAVTLTIVAVTGFPGNSDNGVPPGAITYGRVVQLHHAETEFTEQIAGAESELERLYNIYTLEALEEEESYTAIKEFSEVELEWTEEETTKVEAQGETEPGYTEAEEAEEAEGTEPEPAHSGEQFGSAY